MQTDDEKRKKAARIAEKAVLFGVRYGTGASVFNTGNTERVVVCNHCGEVVMESVLDKQTEEHGTKCRKADGLMDMHCADCGKEILHEVGGLGVGYARLTGDDVVKYVCYHCIAERDKKRLRETGTLQGYLVYDQQPSFGRGTFTKGFRNVVNGKFTNWPGSFSLPVARVKRSYNNFGADREDFWLTFEGKTYHGTHYGNSHQIATIKVVKDRKR